MMYQEIYTIAYVKMQKMIYYPVRQTYSPIGV